MPGGELRRLFCLPSMLLGFLGLFGVGKAVLGLCHLVGYAETAFHEMECPACDGASHTGYCGYSPGENNRFDYLNHGNYET